MIDRRSFYRRLSSVLLFSLICMAGHLHAADKLVGLHSAQAGGYDRPEIPERIREERRVWKIDGEKNF
jgi:hypothetical protein